MTDCCARRAARRPGAPGGAYAGAQWARRRAAREYPAAAAGCGGAVERRACHLLAQDGETRAALSRTPSIEAGAAHARHDLLSQGCAAPDPGERASAAHRETRRR